MTMVETAITAGLATVTKSSREGSKSGVSKDFDTPIQEVGFQRVSTRFGFR